MDILRVIGGIFVLSSATALGYIKTRNYYDKISQLQEFHRGMELVSCQMNYTLYSIPKLLLMVGSQLKGPSGKYFVNLSKSISEGIPRHRAYKNALQKTKGLHLPGNGLMALIEWSSTLGQFDPEGENRIMKLSIQRMEQALHSYQDEKQNMVKSYTLLGACAGIAMIILLL